MGFTYRPSIGKGVVKKRANPKGHSGGVVAGDCFRRRGIRLDGELGISTVTW